MIKPDVILKEESPYYDIFEGGRVPVISPLSVYTPLEGGPSEDCWKLDVKRCTKAQLQEVAETIAQVFNADPEEVMAEMLEHGLPIRASQVAVRPAIDLRFIL